MAKRTWKQIEASGSISDAEMVEHGIARADITVLRFTDSQASARWFMRSHEVLGTINTLVFDNGKPVDPTGLAKAAHSIFGADSSVVW